MNRRIDECFNQLRVNEVKHAMVFLVFLEATM